jgi:hypothetical protein
LLRDYKKAAAAFLSFPPEMSMSLGSFENSRTQLLLLTTTTKGNGERSKREGLLIHLQAAMNRFGSRLVRPLMRQQPTLTRQAVPVVAPQRQLAVRGIRTRSSGVWDTIYDTFLSSTSRYIAAIIVVAVGADFVFNSAIDVAWESANRGVRGICHGCPDIFHAHILLLCRDFSTRLTGLSSREKMMTMMKTMMMMMTMNRLSRFSHIQFPSNILFCCGEHHRSLIGPGSVHGSKMLR